jgi:hypothetical protein
MSGQPSNINKRTSTPICLICNTDTTLNHLKYGISVHLWSPICIKIINGNQRRLSQTMYTLINLDHNPRSCWYWGTKPKLSSHFLISITVQVFVNHIYAIYRFIIISCAIKVAEISRDNPQIFRNLFIDLMTSFLC